MAPSHLNPVALQLVGATGRGWWVYWMCISVDLGSNTHTHTQTASPIDTAALIPAVLSVNISGWSHVDWYDSAAEPGTLQLRSADESVSTGRMSSSGAATLHCLAGQIGPDAGRQGGTTEPTLNFMWNKTCSREESLPLVMEFLFNLFQSEYFREKQRFASVYLCEMTGASEIIHVSAGSCCCLLLSCYCPHIDFISILDPCLH